MDTSRVAVLARRVLARYLDRVGMEHPTEEAKKKHLEEHPHANPEDHTVKGEDDKGSSPRDSAARASKYLEEMRGKLDEADADELLQMTEDLLDAEKAGNKEKAKDLAKALDDTIKDWKRQEAERPEREKKEKAQKEEQTKATKKKRQDHARTHDFAQDIVRDLGAAIPDSWREAKDTLGEEMDEVLRLVNKAKTKAKGDKYDPDEERHTKDADQKLDSMMSNVEHNVRRVMRDDDADADEKKAAKKMWEVVQKWHAGF